MKNLIKKSQNGRGLAGQGKQNDQIPMKGRSIQDKEERSHRWNYFAEGKKRGNALGVAP
jgi:hypothetical protein